VLIGTRLTAAGNDDDNLLVVVVIGSQLLDLGTHALVCLVDYYDWMVFWIG
jgi:hypothetical protein